MFAKFYFLVAGSILVVSLARVQAATQTYALCDNICAMRGVPVANKNINCNDCCQRHARRLGTTGTCGGVNQSPWKCYCNVPSPNQTPAYWPQGPIGRPQGPIRTQGPGARYQAPGARPQAPGARYQIPIGRPQAPSPRYNVPVARPQAPNPRYNVPVARPQAPNPRYNVPVTRPQPLSKPGGGSSGFGDGGGGTCLKEVNEVRQSHRLNALQVHPKLVQTAKTHNAVMIKYNCYEHNCPGEPILGTRARQAGFNYDTFLIGETLLAGNLNSCQRAMKDWLESPTHRAELLRPEYTYLGCDIATSTTGKTDWRFYYTCNYANIRKN